MTPPDLAAIDLSTTVAGVHLPFPAMNAAGVHSISAGEVRHLASSATGAVVIGPVTVHPFIHPQYRTLHNPGFDKLVPFARELAAAARAPIVASVAGATREEYALLAHAFADAGAALIEADLAEPWVHATLAPFETRETLADVASRLVAASAIPVVVKLPERFALPPRAVIDTLVGAGVLGVVVENGFSVFEKFVLVAQGALEVIALGGIRSGYDVSRALAKGAAAVQVRGSLRAEGPSVFARLAREMRIARAAGR